MLKSTHGTVAIQTDEVMDMSRYSSAMVGTFNVEVRASQNESTPKHSMKESALSSDLALKLARNRVVEPPEDAKSPMENYVNTKKLLIGAIDGDRYTLLR